MIYTKGHDLSVLLTLDVVGTWVSRYKLFGVDAGGRLNKKDGLTRYGNSHVKDKTS